MKKIVILAILLAFGVTSLYAERTEQDTVFNQFDHLNRKQGHWKKRYKNGNLAYHGFFKDDKPRGDFFRYNEDGILRVKLTYSNCGDTAKAVFFYPNGKEVANGNFLHNRKDGEWKYFALDGRLILTENFKEGKKDGDFLTYYPEGNVYEQVTWLNDEKNGAIIQYFPNGNYKMSVRYENGKENGPLRVYYPNNQPRIEGEYKNGLKNGLWIVYSPEGEITKKIEYKNGFAKNQEELLEQENQELENMFKNAGKISEPSVEEFFQQQGTSQY